VGKIVVMSERQTPWLGSRFCHCRHLVNKSADHYKLERITRFVVNVKVVVVPSSAPFIVFDGCNRC